MDLGSINEKILLNVQRAQIEQIVAISKSLGLKIGSQFLALAEKVSQATPEQRAEMMKAIDQSLAQLNKSSGAPATQALIAQLNQQKQWLQEPGLKLVNLGLSTLVTNPNSPPNLLTYTNQPLQTGQPLLLQLADGGRLQLLQSMNQAQFNSLVNALRTQGIELTQLVTGQVPGKNTPGAAGISPLSPAPSTALLKEINSKLAGIDIQQLLVSKDASPPKGAGINDTHQTVVSESLRQLLPQKDSGQDLLASLPKVIQFIQQLPLAQRKEWLPATLQDALKSLANQIRTQHQLSDPKQLAVTLRNNGQTFENKLAQLIQQAGTATPNNATPAAHNSPALGKLQVPAEKLALLETTKTIAGKAVATPLEKMFTQDLKGNLLGVLHLLDTERSTLAATMPTQFDSTKNLPLAALPQFLNLLANKHQGELSQKQLRTQLILLMHQYTLGSLAKIQLQQLHSINQQLSQVDVSQPNQSWQFEIPVRQGQDVHPLQIQIEQQWIEEQTPEGHSKASRVRQWNVMLNFDLPIVGKFYAQLGLLGETLTAKFWAEHETTLAETKAKIEMLTQQLEQQGIKVSQVHCLPGTPPKPKMLLSYSLVDVKT